MTAHTHWDQPRQLEDHDQRSHGHPPNMPASDPVELSPLCDELEFAQILEEMVADEAPRLFAVVQEYGERVDGRIAAWGLAFADHTEVASVEGGLRTSLQAPEGALRLFACGSHVRARLVWFNPDAATPADCDDERPHERLGWR
ncbi:hypothetical protein [Actinoalloteichus caeruleus]|uniref:hypothetical protein n=1 Tax=Actinoalloteichus cyanogriseus TaxID=2893586 RepID=UPI003BB8AAB4